MYYQCKHYLIRPPPKANSSKHMKVIARRFARNYPSAFPRKSLKVCPPCFRLVAASTTWPTGVRYQNFPYHLPSSSRPCPGSFYIPLCEGKLLHIDDVQNRNFFP